ncbi:MAG: PLP-dependent aminotransferase family protein [Cyanobacteria bacterium J06641_5]
MDLVVLLDRRSDVPIYRQLAEELRHAVLRGRLKPNQQLPSSRILAKSLGVSRATVTQSYEQLLSEGYFEARPGAGTFVCSQLPDEYLQPKSLARPAPKLSSLTKLSRLGDELSAVDRIDVPEPQEEISFRFNSPSLEGFPIKLWRQLLSRHCDYSAELLDYNPDPAGYMPLRTAIADYLGRSRAVQCNPEQVIIVSGSQQALDLVARLTIETGDWVAMEEPGYLGARYCFKGQGARLHGVTVDPEGLDIEELERCQQSFKLLYVTPSHQFPTGVTLSLPRRLALLQWAQKTGTPILEDDYDSEYRYSDRPIPALQGLDRNSMVIYIGTFSKILFPSLRIGYLVVPTAWIPLVSRAKWLCDRQSPSLEQYALTDCITEGHFERHIRRMRQLYDRHRQVLVNALKQYLDTRVEILGENAGIHLMARIDTNLSDEAVLRSARDLGVGITSAQSYYLNSPKSGEFIFGYAQLDETQIQQGIEKLSQILKA